MTVISIPTNTSGRLIMARYDGQLVPVGHVLKGTGVWVAVLWRSPEQRGQLKDGRTMHAPSMRQLRQALRDRVRLHGRWWS